MYNTYNKREKGVFMAIQLDAEKKRKLSTQDMYDILHFAAQSAEDNGFINQFVYERALYAYAAVILYPDRKQELAAAISNNILDAWDVLIKDGTVENMDKDFSIDMVHDTLLFHTHIYRIFLYY